MKNAILVSKAARWLLVAAAALVFSGCHHAAPAQTRMDGKTIDDVFDIPVGGHPAHLQVAVRTQELEQGLMGRTNLGENAGMLFVFPNESRQSFWMRNTPIALDLGYFDGDGVLREIYPLYPYDEQPVKSRSLHIRYVVEMKQGWFAQNSVHPGDRLDLDAVRAALKARNFDPARYAP